MNAVQIVGCGVWAPGYASVGDWIDRRHDPSVTRPAARMLSARIGRFTSLLTRMAVDVAEQAANQGALDVARTAMVFGSAYGEIQIAFEQLDMIREDGVASPARFKNSVHNTAGGHAAIASGNRKFNTAIAAGSATFAMSLLEAWSWLETHGGEALVSVADELLPPFLEHAGNFEPLGVAVALRSDSAAGCSGMRLANLAPRSGLTAPTPPQGWVENPCAPALFLVEAWMRREAGIVPLEIGGDGWSVDLQEYT